MGEHAGKRVLVTGAAGGAGKAICRLFAAEGATVVMTDIVAEGLNALQAEIAAAGGKAEVQVGDLSSRASCRELASRCGEIDVLINNAAYTFMKFQSVLVPDDEFWDKSFGVGFFAPVTLIQAFGPGMVARKRGNIINISSSSAVRGNPDLAPYAAAKAALEAMSNVAAMEFAMRDTGVRVNTIRYGLVDTPALARNFPDRKTQLEAIRGLVPIGRVIRPEEVAKLCLFLASDASEAIVGSVVTIDGGMTSGAFTRVFGSEDE